MAFEDDEPPSRSRRHPLWQDVPDEQWDDWRWQTQNSIRSVRQLRTLLRFAPDELEALGRLEGDYKLAIPPYYFSLIDPNDPADPIRLQSVPSPLEAENPSGYELDDPLEEDKDSPVPGLTHRYPDRALLITTPNCSMYCRYCTRKRATLTRGGWEGVSADDERMIDYVRKHPEIRDVIVSGGDPLTLPIGKLRFYLESLKAIDHVDVIRIGTRVPVTLPQRLYDPELIDLLASAEKVYIQTHFNHPREITPEAARVCKSLLRAGMPINNHSRAAEGRERRSRHHAQPAPRAPADQGAAVLPVPLRPGDRRRPLPHQRVEGPGDHGRPSRPHVAASASRLTSSIVPHGGGKIPLMPNYLVSMSDDAVILRNYEGMLIRYQAEDKPSSIQPTNTRGVSGLLQGDKTVLIPEDNERMARRKPQAGCEDSLTDCNHNSNGSSPRSLVPLPMLSSNGNGSASDD